MPHFICVTCGTQFADSAGEPDRCPICEDERQYVGLEGQRWTMLEALRATPRNTLMQIDPELYSVGVEPTFAIGQRAILIVQPKGCVLWDCVPLVDDDLYEAIRSLGGLAAIAISHPHYYTTMVEWARAFDCPIYLHAADRQWVMRPDASLVHWEGDSMQLGELTLIRCGGHFDGGCVLHWPGGADGRGALLTGDIIQVVPDRRWVSFMYSYPNLIPLPAAAVRRIVDAVEPYAFDRIYGAWPEKVVSTDAKAAVRRSADRYLRAIGAGG